MQEEEIIRSKFRVLVAHLDERRRRLWAATEAMVLGKGGIATVARATGLARETIVAGVAEVNAGFAAEDAGLAAVDAGIVPPERVRRPGAGRKKAVELDPDLMKTLESLVEPDTRGDPESPLRWTCKSTRKLAAMLTEMGHKASSGLVRSLLRQLGYSLQANRKTIESSSQPVDCDAQFEFINKKAKEEMAAENPVISVDAKKKEPVGNFRNAGSEWRPVGEPEEVKVYDFVDPDLGRATPYGVYDLAHNVGWVSVGTDHDTAAFAVESIRRWWTMMGKQLYPNAKRLFITADGGGSNGSRVRLWKAELQKLADELGIEIHVSHFPPGTSKWNKIEHQMFSFISKNWRGRPLVSYEVIVNLIAATRTTKGLAINAALDTNRYPKGTKVTDEEMAKINLVRDEFHGEWNYAVLPAIGHDN